MYNVILMHLLYHKNLNIIILYKLGKTIITIRTILYINVYLLVLTRF